MRWSGSGMTLLTLPSADELLRPDHVREAKGAGLRRLRLEDLLSRPLVELDSSGLAELFSGHSVLVTGAGGGVVVELCRQAARLGAAELVCIDISEIAIYQLEQELRAAHPNLRCLFYTANVREVERLHAISHARRRT